MTSPTTPRDDITRLSERLRRGHNNSGLSPLDCKIGLDELDAISARMKELEHYERNRDMWKGQCERQAAQLTSLRDVAKAAADTLRQERDEAYERAAKHFEESEHLVWSNDEAADAIRRLAAGTGDF